jgi:hypothetical protein
MAKSLIFNRLMIKCGDMVYVKPFYSLYWVGSRNWTMDVLPAPLSQADQLNGIQWHG